MNRRTILKTALALPLISALPAEHGLVDFIYPYAVLYKHPGAKWVYSNSWRGHSQQEYERLLDAGYKSSSAWREIWPNV